MFLRAVFSIQWNNNNTYEGLFWSDGYEWFHVQYDELNARDITKIIESPNGHLFVGTWNDGILQLEYDEGINNYTVYKRHNHITTNNALQTIESDTSASNFGWLRNRKTWNMTKTACFGPPIR